MPVCYTIANTNMNAMNVYYHNKAVMEKYEGYQFFHAFGAPVANVISLIFPIEPPRTILKEFRGDKITKSTYLTEPLLIMNSIDKLSAHMEQLLHGYTIT